MWRASQLQSDARRRLDSESMKKRAQRLLTVFVVITLLFIWINSMFPADVSGQMSGWVQRLLQPVLDFLYSGRIEGALAKLASRLPAPLEKAVLGAKGALERLLALGPVHLVRKAAHFSEYALLGFFMGLLCVSRDGRLRFLLPECLCLAAAFIDEGIQLFSEGRGASLRDVCIDLSGATLGVLIALLVLVIVGHIGRRPEKAM